MIKAEEVIYNIISKEAKLKIDEFYENYLEKFDIKIGMALNVDDINMDEIKLIIKFFNLKNFEAKFKVSFGIKFIFIEV